MHLARRSPQSEVTLDRADPIRAATAPRAGTHHQLRSENVPLVARNRTATAAVRGDDEVHEIRVALQPVAAPSWRGARESRAGPARERLCNHLRQDAGPTRARAREDPAVAHVPSRPNVSGARDQRRAERQKSTGVATRRECAERPSVPAARALGFVDTSRISRAARARARRRSRTHQYVEWQRRQPRSPCRADSD